jgi:hypothetical protein
MRRAMQVLIGAALISAALAPAWADWNVGDPYKMHFPQLPDRYGLDVNFRSQLVAADDWQCTETGPVSDIHFWMSAKGDWLNLNNPLDQQIYNIHASIHADIPANPAIPNDYSRPADPPLWQDNYGATSPQVHIRRWYPDGIQGWYDPTNQDPNQRYIPGDHTAIYQVNITNIPNPFYQTYGQIYWLDLSISSLLPLGWKSADLSQYPPGYTGRHFMDDAVVSAPGITWNPLDYPLGHPLYGQSMDLAFVITPEPSTLGLVALSGLLLVRRRR